MSTTLDITRRSLFGMVAAALAVKVLPVVARTVTGTFDADPETRRAILSRVGRAPICDPDVGALIREWKRHIREPWRAV